MFYLGLFCILLMIFRNVVKRKLRMFINKICRFLIGLCVLKMIFSKILVGVKIIENEK